MIDLSDPDPINTLANSLGENWPAIQRAKNAGIEQSQHLSALVTSTKPPANTAVVAFGSIARQEWTAKSDVDWTFIVDGPSDIQHFLATDAIRRVLKEREPGRTLTFATLTSSHPLVHQIGGTEDTNQNLTRRILLLLESIALAGSTTHERLVRAILERYILFDPPVSSVVEFRLPRFLLNDVVRLWRTFAVDYATKKWERSNEGWALRNIKLRMSRKLLFAKGLLLCFACDKQFAGAPHSQSQDEVSLELLNRCYALSRLPPMSILASVLIQLADKSVASKLMGAYDQFLELLDDEERRQYLEQLPFDHAHDLAFQKQREASRDFRDGLIELFFNSDKRLTHLTQRYGLF